MIRTLFIFSIILCNIIAKAEMLGTMSIDEIIINSSFEYSEPKNGAFSLDGSLFTLKWENQKNLYILFSVGPLSLLNKSLFISDDEQRFGLLEATANYYGDYGEVRMGLLPVGFSYEGQLRENERYFYRGLIFQKKFYQLRDYGISYKTGYSNYKTSITVHNGESTPENPDGRVFVTSYWGVNSNKFDLGVSGMAGEVKKESLNSNTPDRLNLFVDDETLKIRMGSLFMRAKSKSLDIVTEFFTGQVEQNVEVKKWHSWRADVVYKTRGRIDILARYDYIDPNRSFGGDVLREYTVGLSLRDKLKSNRIFVYATKVIDEGEKDKRNDRYSLVWRVQPKLLDF